MKQLKPLFQLPWKLPPGQRFEAWVRYGLLAFAIGLVIFLFETENPWSHKIVERLESGKKLTLSQIISVGKFWAGCVALATTLLTFLTSGWWLKRLTFPASSAPKAKSSFIVFVLLAVVVGGALRFPLATDSLWWDETWNLQRVVLGEYPPITDETPNPEFEYRDWDRTFYYYQKPTNHIPFSIASKACLTVWHAVTGASPETFNEFIFRLPVYIAGLLSIAAIAWLLHLWGFSIAGIAAAWILAIHPWHIRYAIDGRTFSLVVLFTLLAAIALTRILQTGRLSAYLGFGVSLMMLMWGFPYSFFLCGLMTLGGFFAIWQGSGISREDKFTLSGRLVFSGIFAFTLWLWFFAPLLIQMRLWTDVEGNAMIHFHFLRELWANLTTGMPYYSASVPETPALVGLSEYGWQAKGTTIILIPLLLLLGTLILTKKNPATRWITLALLLAGPITLLFAWSVTHFFYTRYVIYSLIPLLLTVVVGTEWLGKKLLPGNQKRASIIACVLLIVSLHVIQHQQVRLLLTHPISPNKQVAAYLEEVSKDQPDALLVGFNLGGEMPRAYLPRIIWIHEAPALTEILQKAKTSTRPLYLFYGYDAFNRANKPDAWETLDNPALFSKIADFSGIEAAFHYQVFRFIPTTPEP